LLEEKENRQARFITVLGYYDGAQRHFFVEEENGFILEQSQGDNLRGWTDLLYIYGHHSVPNKSLAEYTDLEWNQYLETLKDNDCVSQLAKHLQTATK
jgi:inosine/xanthosine triphosphate pyrophosphatase family protein